MPAAYAEVVRKNHENKVAGRSNDLLLVFKQHFSTFSTNMAKYGKKIADGHATVVDSYATVDRLSDNDFSTFRAIWKLFEKSRWTVRRQWSEVTRPSADCQTTFFWRFKQFGNFLKKVDERSRDSGWEVTRPSTDCQTTIFRRFEQFGKFLKKVAEQSRDSGRRSSDRRPTVKQRFLEVSSNQEIFWKKSLIGHATVVGGHATVGRLSNNVFWRFKQLGEILKEVTERSRDSGRWFTRPSADCRKTFFRCFKQFGNFLKKVTERSRDSGRKSRDRRPVCQAHICMNKRERERERESISVTLHTGTAMLCRWPFHQPASPLKLALTRVGDRQGQLVYEYCKSSHWQVEFMLCDLYL